MPEPGTSQRVADHFTDAELAALLAEAEAEAPNSEWAACVVHLCAELQHERAEYESLSTALDGDLSFQDLEMKIRDGSVHIHAIGTDEGGAPQYRIVAGILWNLLLGDENELPPNYRCIEWIIKPGGSFEGVRLVGEIVRPGHPSSHEIRKDLERRIADAG